MAKLVHLRVEEKLYKQAKDASANFGFSTVQEFIRSAIRSLVEEYEKKMAIRRLEALRGSVKNIKRMTKAERDKHFGEFIKKKEKGYDVFKKYGL